jgi:hypothetical protein
LTKSIVLFAISILAIAAGSAVCPGAVSAGELVIDSFTAVPDCIFPDPRRHILSYRVSGSILRVRLYAIHRGGRLREFYSQPAGAHQWPLAVCRTQALHRISNPISCG